VLAAFSRRLYSYLVLKENDQVIGRFYPKNWYSNSGIAEIDGEKIEYRIVNNPLAEIRFLYHDNLLISCGIKHQKGKIGSASPLPCTSTATRSQSICLP
jgi:hypothetical protein